MSLACWPVSPILSMKERSVANGLRAKMVDYMCDNYNSYRGLDVETINGDLPPWLHYSSMEDRIAAMADPLSLPGELELIATSNVLSIPIVVFTGGPVVWLSHICWCADGSVHECGPGRRPLQLRTAGTEGINLWTRRKHASTIYAFHPTFFAWWPSTKHRTLWSFYFYGTTGDHGDQSTFIFQWTATFTTYSKYQWDDSEHTPPPPPPPHENVSQEDQDM